MTKRTWANWKEFFWCSNYPNCNGIRFLDWTPYTPKAKTEPVSNNGDKVEGENVEQTKDENKSKKVFVDTSHKIYNKYAALQVDASIYKEDENDKRLVFQIAWILDERKKLYDWKNKWIVTLDRKEMMDLFAFLLRRTDKFKIFHDPNAGTEKKNTSNSGIEGKVNEDWSLSLQVKVKKQEKSLSFFYKLSDTDIVFITAKILDALSVDLQCDKNVVFALVMNIMKK